MLTLFPALDRGRSETDWLDSAHTFSFGEYYDASRMGFRSLRVINEDRVQPGTGFKTHSHRDMEILTLVIDGEIEHKDSLGNGSTIRPGQIQRMSAGTGILHSEWNPSPKYPVHFLQIWIMPDRKGIAPSYAQENWDSKTKPCQWIPLASGVKGKALLHIHQDAELLLSHLERGDSLDYHFKEGRAGWLQVVKGRVKLKQHELVSGDGVKIQNLEHVSLEGISDQTSEILLFDLAP